MDIQTLRRIDADARAMLRTCVGSTISLSDLADMVYCTARLDGARSGAEERIITDMSRRRQDFSKYGNPIDLNAVLHIPSPVPDGVFWNSEETCALVSVGGYGFGILLHTQVHEQAPYGVLHDYDGYVFANTCAVECTRAWRKHHSPGFSANTTRKTISPTIIAACGGRTLLAAVVQWSHRSLFSTKGSNTAVFHDKGHMTTNAIRYRQQELVGRYLKQLFPHDAISTEDSLGGALGRMRLDYFIPSRRLAVEYDGEQHERPVDFSGRKSSAQQREELRALQQHDALKDAFCQKQGITLVRFSHRDDITPDGIRNRLRDAGVDVPESDT